jgi:hypothetical protein
MSTINPIGFDIETDGIIYGIKRQGAIKNNKLYFPEEVLTRDFFIEENTPGEEVEYNIFLKLIGENFEIVDINSVAIKEILSMEVDI